MKQGARGELRLRDLRPNKTMGVLGHPRINLWNYGGVNWLVFS